MAIFNYDIFDLKLILSLNITSCDKYLTSMFDSNKQLNANIKLRV